MRCRPEMMRLYAVTDRAWTKKKSLIEQVEEAICGGATCIQLREKNLDEEAFLREAIEMQKLCETYQVPLIINDHVEIAKHCKAAGVHLGQKDMEAGRARGILGPKMILGVSARTVEQAVQAERAGADYLGVGAVFQTSTKTDAKEISHAILKEMVNTLFEGKAKIESDNNIARKEMLDYYSLWVHQIKTPIAAMRILLQAAEEISFEKRTELEMELFKIEQYVEMALSYIRLGNMASDLKLQWYPMDEIIKPAVKKYSKLFILKKIKLKYEPIENKILTDEKWLGLVVEQILSNALKYTNEGTISIYLGPKKENVLVIEDTGIGIWQEDLPRVFEKGFTGYNGRTDKKSTGIGLYLCKSIVDKLNHRIYISSEVSKGTKIFLNLNRDDFRLE